MSKPPSVGNAESCVTASLTAHCAESMRRWLRGSALNELVFFVTSRCPLRCRTCFYDRLDSDAGRAELALDEIEAICRSIGHLERLHLSGGEPLLRKDLAGICATFARICGVRHIHLPTNGLDPQTAVATTQKILATCAGMDLTVSVCLDGLEEAHDRVKGVQGAFRKAVDTVRALMACKPDTPGLGVYVITVVTKENLAVVPDLVEWVESELRPDGHGPSPVRGKPRDAALVAPSAEEWRTLAQRIGPILRRGIARAAGSRLRTRLARNRMEQLYGLYGRVLGGEQLPFRCGAGVGIGVLEPDGDVRLCEETPVVGNVRDTGLDFRVVWDRATRQPAIPSGCACTHACFLTPALTANPRSALRLLLGRLP